MFFDHISYWDLQDKDPVAIQTYEDWCEQLDLDISYFGEYLLVIEDCLNRGIKSVVDIGCAEGCQGWLFKAAGIRYVGIEESASNLRLGEYGQMGDDMILRQGTWPCSIPEAEGIETAIALYSIGSHDIQHLAKTHLKSISETFTSLYLATFRKTQRLCSRMMKSIRKCTLEGFGPHATWMEYYQCC